MYERPHSEQESWVFENGPEHFIGPKQDYALDFRRREAFQQALEAASKDPDIFESGIDIQALNTAVKAAGGMNVDLREAPGGATSWLAKFDSEIKYVPLEAIENHPGSMRPELEMLREYAPYAREAIGHLVAEAGLEEKVQVDVPIVIGVERKSGVPYLRGGLHSPMGLQGFKTSDRLIIANIPNGTDDRSEYKGANVLRSMTHDLIHSIQYKLYSRLRKSGTGTQLNGVQVDLMFDGKEGAVDVGEYLTDKMALKIMHDYLKSRGQELPSPETEFEQIEYSDLHGEQVVITPEQIEALPGGSERSAAESMQMYRTQIFESAEAFFSLLGPYREAAETALFFDTLTGKLTRTSMLGKELKANNYHTPEGDLLPLSRIREYSASVPALRVLFPHNAIQNAIEEETGPWSAVA